MNAISQAVHFWNQPLPASVLVKAAAVGKIPVRTTSRPPRTIMSTICRTEARIATSPSRMIMTAPIGLTAESWSMPLMFSLNEVPLVEFLMIQAENSSAVTVRSPTAATPAPETTTSVARERPRSRSGAPLRSMIILAAPTSTDSTARAAVQK
ncbi:hypothetical protein [Sinomonas atrocyanea]